MQCSREPCHGALGDGRCSHIRAWGLSDAYTKYGHAFYQNDEPQNIYDRRLQHILEYIGKHTGRAWKDFEDVILAFDLQNEPYVGVKDGAGVDCAGMAQNDKDWVCKRATKMRDILGGSQIKIATGGLGGADSNGCSFLSTAMACNAIDAIASEFCPRLLR